MQPVVLVAASKMQPLLYPPPCFSGRSPNTQTHVGVPNLITSYSYSSHWKQRTTPKKVLLLVSWAFNCSCSCSLSYQCQKSSELRCTRRSFDLGILFPLLATELLGPCAIALDSDSSQSTIISNPLSEPSVEPKAAQTYKAVRKMVDTEEWYRFRGEGFSIRIPPGFEDIADPDESGGGYSLYGERAKPKTFAARFSSPDRLELLSVVIRFASQLKLSFFEVSDISELGPVSEAAKMFIPARAKLVYAEEVKPGESNLERTYYLYEFLADDNCVVMKAAAANGKVYVAGAVAPRSEWRNVGGTMRSAAISFSLL